ncbi:transcriptional regulator [Bacillus sp. FJAT-27264]|uniref:MarR family winged helix-turn-helix transcriptional regulator n=1 Tax=Paenibacillus sp. (strain DSM 101736 / FJAT-27264) TaxID=1850362 RepID=UPI000807DAB2|nr:MarR family transcriptional regulator [Bacillus sp. FJAT-27264]OBZ14853.1 transcriptional regulator [Bacillus sp. FJAT-27264]
MNLDNEQHQLDLRLIRVYMNSVKSVVELMKKDISRYGLDIGAFHILEFLYNKGPHAIQKIGEKFSIPSGSVTYVVDKLEKKGFIQREVSAEDRRLVMIKLTDDGQALFDDIFPKHAQTIADMLSVLADEDKHQLTELLKKLGMQAESKLKS